METEQQQQTEKVIGNILIMVAMEGDPDYSPPFSTLSDLSS
jgi:hypothetical protein